MLFIQNQLEVLRYVNFCFVVFLCSRLSLGVGGGGGAEVVSHLS